MTDANYTCIDTKTLNANHINVKTIHASSMTIDDNNIDLDLKTAPSKIKELYECNQDTNCFTDILHNFLSSIYNVFNYDTRNMNIEIPDKLQLNAANGVYFNIIDNVDYSDIPENTGVWCFSKKYGMIFKFKKNGKMLFTYGNTCEWVLPVSLKVVDDSISVQLSTI